MKSIHLIAVGKLKDKSLIQIEDDYLKRIKNPGLKIHEVRANAEKPAEEAKNILAKTQSIDPQARLILLTEWGKEYESTKFSKWLDQKLEQNTELVFVICGAQGPTQELKNLAHDQISLSKLTFPHKLARIILVEQLYRAQTIRERHPYHN